MGSHRKSALFPSFLLLPPSFSALCGGGGRQEMHMQRGLKTRWARCSSRVPLVSNSPPLLSLYSIPPPLRALPVQATYHSSRASRSCIPSILTTTSPSSPRSAAAFARTPACLGAALEHQQEGWARKPHTSHSVPYTRCSQGAFVTLVPFVQRVLLRLHRPLARSRAHTLQGFHSVSNSYLLERLQNDVLPFLRGPCFDALWTAGAIACKCTVNAECPHRQVGLRSRARRQWVHAWVVMAASNWQMLFTRWHKF